MALACLRITPPRSEDSEAAWDVLRKKWSNLIPDQRAVITSERLAAALESRHLWLSKSAWAFLQAGWTILTPDARAVVTAHRLAAPP